MKVSIFEVGESGDRYVIHRSAAKCESRTCPLIHPQRLEQATRYKFPADRFACLKSYLMLQEMTGIYEPLEFAYNDYGKPYLLNHPDIYFNISHCPAAIAVAVSDHPVGIDIECFHTPDDALLRHTMNDDEIHRITSSPNPSETFTTFWTQKEALLKCLGTGITSDLRSVLETATAIHISHTHINPQKQYIYTICENFSENPLPSQK